MSALDWAFAALCALAALLAAGWPNVPRLVRCHPAAPVRGASEIRHPAMQATRAHLTAHPLPRQRSLSNRKGGNA